MHTTQATYTTLRQGLDDAALLSTEHQLHLASLLGGHPKWRLTIGAGNAEFITRAGTILTAIVHPIGIMDSGTWTWAWCDPRIPDSQRRAARQVEAFGHAHRISMLEHEHYPLTAAHTRVTADQLVVFSKNVHRLWRHFAFDMRDNSTLYAALHFTDLELPPPSVASIRQTVRTTVSAVPLTRFRRATVSYARLRGIPHRETRAHDRIQLMADDGTVELDWTTGALRMDNAAL